MIGYKVTRPDGTDFYSGTVDYAKALESGKPIVHPDPQKATGEVCGRGLHVSDTPQLAIGFASRDCRPWRYFKVEFVNKDVIEKDVQKKRLSRIKKVIAELTLADIFGADFGERIARVKDQAEGWKLIPWLKPKKPIKQTAIESLFAEWHAAISPWDKRKLPHKVKIVTTVAVAAAAAAAAADAAADADAVAAAAADAVAAAAADAVAAAAADAVAAADADADAAADAVAAAAADADAAAAADAVAWYWRCRWYVWPRRVLWRHARWQLAGMTQPNPWKPLVEMYEMGAMPIGYSNGEFVVYCPKVKR